MRRISILLIGGMISFIVCNHSFSAGEVRISEIHPTIEYIELENITNTDISLQMYTWSELSGGDEKFYTFESTDIVEANNFFVISIGSKINNSGDTIRLYLENTLIDEVVVPTNEDDLSYSLQSDGSFAWATPTEGTTNTDLSSNEETSSEVSSLSDPTLGDIILNEISADPSTGNEYIEIYNLQNENFSLQNTIIEDAVGNIFTGSSNYQISANGYFLISLSSSKLNNTGDSVSLFVNDTLLDTYSFGSINSDEIWSRSPNGTGEWTNEVISSPNSENPSINTSSKINNETTNTGETPTSTDIIINEVSSNPSIGNEFIEIKNISDKTLSLTSLIVEDLAGKSASFTKNTISPNEYTIAEYTSSALNNSGETIYIKWETQVLLELEIPASKNDQVYARIPDETGSFGFTYASTPESKNPDPITYPTGIIVSEILPNPDGDDATNEWIELYNTSENEIDITGWSIQDLSGKTYTFNSGSIVSQNYLTIYRPESGITLNNSDEGVSLLDPSGNIHSTLSFGGSLGSGISYAVFDDGNKATQKPTPNTENIYLAPITTSSGGSNGSSHVLISEKRFTIQTYRPHPPKILITQVAPAQSKIDFVEAWCIECNIDLEGIRIADDDEVFRIPLGTIASSGDVLRFEWHNDIDESITIKTKYGYLFQIADNGITKTDETIFIMDHLGNILDAMCYADESKTFTKREEQDIGKIIIQKQWKGSVKAYDCINSHEIKNNITFVRRSDIEDTNTKNDFFRVLNPISQKNYTSPNTLQSTDLEITEIQVQETTLKISIQNKGDKIINLQHFYILGNDKYLDTIEDETWISKNQILNIDIPFKKISPFAYSIDLKDPYGKSVAFFCGGDGYNTSNIKSVVQKAFRKNIWHTPRYESCFHHDNNISTSFFLNKNKIEKITFKSIDPQTKNKNSPQQDEEKNLKILQSVALQKPKYIALSKRQDLNNNTIADHWEDFLQRQNQEVSKAAYTKYLEQNTTIDIQHINYQIQVSGIVESGSHINIFYQSERIDEFDASARGNFETILSFPFLAGDHILTFEITTPEGFLYSITKSFMLTTDLRADEIDMIKIVSVLPNPQGRDSGNERISIQNTSQKSGWIRGWTIENITQKAIPLPHIYLEKDEIYRFSAPFSLKNKNEKIILRDYSEKEISSLSWDNAKEGIEIFENQKERIKNIIRKKTPTKKITPPKNTNSEREIKEASQEIIQEIWEEASIIHWQNPVLIIQIKKSGDLIRFTPDISENPMLYNLLFFPEKTIFIQRDQIGRIHFKF